LSDRVLVTSIVPLPKPPIILVERAKEILGSIGYKPGADYAYGFVPANFLGYAGRHPELVTRQRLASGTPAALHFWYRDSPAVMIPTGDRDRVSLDDPAFTISGMSIVVIDPQGRLIRLAVVPPQFDPAPADGSRESGGGAAPQAVNWKPLFDAAGLDPALFKAAPPEWTPTMYADTRMAWTGRLPGLPGQQLRIEGGAYRGQPVYFYPVAPWTTTSRMANTIAQRNKVTWTSVLVKLVIFAMFVAGALIARHNIRKGRGDRRGAAQLSGLLLVAALSVWVLDSKHVADPNIEMTRFFIGQPLWAIGLLWLLYLAVEPYVRRFWPATLVSWSRLMARQWRDPLVGRDVLFGVALGAALCALSVSATYAASRLGRAWTPDVRDLQELLGTSAVVARTLNQIFSAVLNAIFCLFGMVLLKLIVRREWVASITAIALAMLLAVNGSLQGELAMLNIASALVMVAIIVLTIQRLGLVATTVMFFVYFTLSNAIVTLDTSRWFFADSLVQLLIPVGLTIYGFYVSRGGEPLFGRRLLE
jgi:hypothetical protein